MTHRRIRYETRLDPSQTLAPEEQASLLADIIELNARLSSNTAFADNWRARSSSFMADTSIIVLAYEGEELVGHFSCKQLLLGERWSVYIDTFTVHPRMHHAGLGTRMALRLMWQVLRRAGGLEFMLGSRISAPCLATATRSVVGADNYYPRFDGQPSTPELASTATALAEQLWPDKRFDLASGALEGAYGGRFLPERRTRDAAVQTHFDRHICAGRGDALVQVCHFRWSTWLVFARTMFARSLRPSRTPRPERVAAR